jgi:flagellar FliL protein
MAEEKPEEAGKEGEHGEEKPKKKGLPILWIIIGLLVVLLVGGAVYFLKFMKGPEKDAGKGKAKVADGEHKEAHEEEAEEEPAHEEEHAEEASHGEEGEEHAEEGEHGGGGKVKCPAEQAAGGHGGAKPAEVNEIFTLEPFIVNLAGSSDIKFLKVNIKLKLAKPTCHRFVMPHTAEIRDSILMLLSSKEYEMVNTVQGKMELRDEVLERVKNIVKGDKVQAAFFTDFVAQ